MKGGSGSASGPATLQSHYEKSQHSLVESLCSSQKQVVIKAITHYQFIQMSWNFVDKRLTISGGQNPCLQVYMHRSFQIVFTLDPEIHFGTFGGTTAGELHTNARGFGTQYALGQLPRLQEYEHRPSHRASKPEVAQP